MKLRSFIAVEIPAEIQRAIQRNTASLQQTLPKPMVRWVETQNLHLTLKFLGDVSPEELKHLAEALEAGLITQDSFDMSVSGLGAFPTLQRPRIIWVGLDAPATLVRLQQNVDAFASRTGFHPDDLPFSPHLTIGRVGQGTTRADDLKIRAAMVATTIGYLGTVHVEAVTIFKSDLRPGGPVYTPLYTLPLKS
jgi:RNA 2',3'-cyclic 3'-phosphodiesterase